MGTSIVRVAVCGATILAAVGTVFADINYDSKGFEAPTFALGFLQGQNGYFHTTLGGGLAPEVVVGPDWSTHGRCVRLQVPDAEGAMSGMDLSWGDLLAADYQQVTVSFDIYRQTDQWTSDLGWGWHDPGHPATGFQWDQDTGASVTIPFDPGPNTPTVMDRWTNLTMTWDFIANQATATYNGAPAGSMAISGINLLTGWEIILVHNEATGHGSEVVWIDNFVISGVVPEPSTMPLAGLVCLGMLRHRRP